MSISWVWKYYEKLEDKKVLCLKCKDEGKTTKLAFHNSTSSLSNHLKYQHKVEQQGPKSVYFIFVSLSNIL